MAAGILQLSPSEVFYPVSACSFASGTNPQMSLASIGSITTSKLLVSFWFQILTTGNFQYLLSPGNGNVMVAQYSSSSHKISIQSSDDNFGTNYLILQPNVLVNDGKWHHVMASWDTNFSSGSRPHNCYIDGVAQDTVTDSGSAFSIDYNSSPGTIPFNIGGSGAIQLKSLLAEVYFTLGTYLDLSILANRRKFLTASNRPAFLGSDGSLPLGSSPLIYLKNSGSGFNINSGSLGNFTTTGTLTAPTTTPSAP